MSNNTFSDVIEVTHRRFSRSHGGVFSHPEISRLASEYLTDSGNVAYICWQAGQIYGSKNEKGEMLVIIYLQVQELPFNVVD